jgi:hypothetical protein
VPIPGEVEIEAATAFADVEHGSLDELIGMNEAPEALGVARVLDAIGGRGPEASRLPLASFSRASNSAVQAWLSGSE